MSVFRVGQRVRVVWAEAYPEFVGRECVIVEGPRQYFNPAHLCWYWGYTTDLHPQFGPRADALEPIVDEGREVVEWSDCLWQPEGIAA